MKRGVVLALVVCTWVVCVNRAQAGGLYFAERGVKGLGRAGANVAGAHGLDAIGYNVAGHRGTAIGGDLTQLFLSVDVRRELAIEDASGATQRVYSPTIAGESELLPLPTLAFSVSTKDDRYTFAAGLFTPTFALASFPAKVEGQPSPARYTLSGFTDSRLLLLGAWGAMRVTKELSLGLGVHALVGTFRSSLGFSLSLPDRLLAAPEDPDYDAYGRINVGPTVAPSGTVGVLYAPTSYLTLGLSADLPTWLDSDATFDVRLPTSAVFDTVEVRGKSAHVSMMLPAIMRAGIEVRPLSVLALELAYVREFWSQHDEIVVDPKGVSVDGIVGGPKSLALPTIRIPRRFRDTGSLRGAFEFSETLFEVPFRLRGGVMYEKTAVKPAYLSLSSLDFDKTVVSLGVGFTLLARVTLDLAYAHMFLHRERVTLDEARIARVQPLSGNAPDDIVNAGTYRANAHLLSAGVTYAFR